MFTEEEIREDQKRVMDLISALELKYGESFSIVMAMGVDLNGESDNEDHQWAGCARCSGRGYLIHQCCHALFDNSIRFIDEALDTMKCIFANSKRIIPNKIAKARDIALEAIKKDLIMETSEYKEAKSLKDAQEAVDGFLKDIGFKTEN